jgi:hypothetical protein
MARRRMLLTYLRTYPPTYLPTLPTYPPTYLPTFLPSYLRTARMAAGRLAVARSSRPALTEACACAWRRDSWKWHVPKEQGKRPGVRVVLTKTDTQGPKTMPYTPAQYPPITHTRAHARTRAHSLMRAHSFMRAHETSRDPGQS